MTRSRLRVLLGFLVAPGIPGLLATLAAALLSSDLTLVAGMLTFLAYVAALVVGVPAYLYARARGLAALRKAALLTANIGLGAYVLIAGYVTLMDALASPFRAVMTFLASLLIVLAPAVYGVCALWLFRRIALRGPEQRFAP